MSKEGKITWKNILIKSYESMLCDRGLYRIIIYQKMINITIKYIIKISYKNNVIKIRL